MIVYDVEVVKWAQDVEGGWENPHGMGFGTGVAYNYKDDRYHFFQAHQKGQLIDLLCSNSPVISFNGVRFDNKVLLGNDYATAENDALWSDLDILLEVVRSRYGVRSVAEAEERFTSSVVHNGVIALDGLSRGTLRLSKSGYGGDAPRLIREEKWAEVFAYNLNDVRLTRKLFEFIRDYGFLVDRDGETILLPKVF